MGGLSKGVLYGSVFFFGFVLMKDGTLPKLVNTAATGANDLIGGLKPLTNLA